MRGIIDGPWEVLWLISVFTRPLRRSCIAAFRAWISATFYNLPEIFFSLQLTIIYL
jgi:hypothetical protein